MIKQEENLTEIFVSDVLISDFEEVYKQLNTIIPAENLHIIPGCKDIWVRDFMPINLYDDGDRLLTYRYEPDYLRENATEYINFHTEQKAVLFDMGIRKQETFDTELVLDGGNIVECDGVVILTDKIYRENPKYNRQQVRDELKRIFKEEVKIIPWVSIEDDVFGHSDGSLTYLGIIDGKKTILFETSDFSIPPILNAQRDVLKSLEAKGYKIRELQLKSGNRFDWCYINMLHYKNKLLVPQVDGITESNQIALDTISNICGDDREVIGIKIPQRILKMGGALHCMTWNSDRAYLI